MQNKSKWFYCLLGIVNVLFILYFLILAYYNRPSQDDWLFARVINEIGSWNFLVQTYMHQSGRIIGYALHCINYQIPVMLLAKIMPVLSYSLALLSLYGVTRKLMPKSLLRQIVVADTILNAFVMSNFEFSAFYWICASLGIFGAALWVYLFVLLTTTKGDKWDIVLIIGILILKFMSSEVYSLLFAGLLFLTLLYRLHKEDATWKDLMTLPSNQWIVATMATLVVGTALVVAAPGNYERAGESMYVHAASIGGFIVAWVKNLVLYFYLYAFKIPYLIAVLLIMLFIGYEYEHFPIDCTLKQMVLYGSLIYMVFIAFAVAPMAYLMSGFGFQRFYMVCVLIGVVILALIGWRMGSWLRNNRMGESTLHKVLIGGYCAWGVLAFCAVYHIIIDTPTVQHYAACQDQRIQLILSEKSKGRTETLYLESMPSAETAGLKYLLLGSNKLALYYRDAITNNPNDYSNKCIAEYFDIGFSIVTNEE